MENKNNNTHIVTSLDIENMCYVLKAMRNCANCDFVKGFFADGLCVCSLTGKVLHVTKHCSDWRLTTRKEQSF